MKTVETLLETAGLGKDRVRLRWVSAAEGQVFAQYVREYTETLGAIGPLDTEAAAGTLDAALRALSTPRLRWLTGMEIQITERGNVYGEHYDEAAYERMLRQTIEEEFQKALILVALAEGPMSLRDIAFETGLPIHAASVRLNDLERTHAAHLAGYDGTTPRFAATA